VDTDRWQVVVSLSDG